MYNLLFICTGNTCRSSMAEGILKKAVENDSQLKGKICVLSAGISAFDGEPASTNSIKVLKFDWDIDISSHRAKRICESDIRDADLILTMTREHKKAIISLFPDAKDRVFTLKEYVLDVMPDKSMEGNGYSLDIMDPYGMSVETYRKCAWGIKDAVNKLVKKLKGVVITFL